LSIITGGTCPEKAVVTVERYSREVEFSRILSNSPDKVGSIWFGLHRANTYNGTLNLVMDHALKLHF